MIDSLNDLEGSVGKFIEKYRKLSQDYQELFDAHEALDHKYHYLLTQKQKAADQVKGLISQLQNMTEEVI